MPGNKMLELLQRVNKTNQLNPDKKVFIPIKHIDSTNANPESDRLTRPTNNYKTTSPPRGSSNNSGR